MLAIEVLDWRIVNRGAWSLTSYTGFVAGHLVANDWRIARDVIAIESAGTFTTREVARDHVRPESSGSQFQHRGRASTSSGVYAKCISSALKLGADEGPAPPGTSSTHSDPYTAFRCRTNEYAVHGFLISPRKQMSISICSHHQTTARCFHTRTHCVQLRTSSCEAGKR